LLKAQGKQRKENIMLTRRSASIASLAAVLSLAGNRAVMAAGRERHPNIRRAMEALRAARDDLEHADHDFGGHRVEAIESIDRAIRQLQIALRFDVR
jgi:hypothetical protein